MFAQTTVMAMLALSDADSAATDAERRRFRSFLNGDEKSCGEGVLTFVEAARRLGAKNPQFARRLAKCGRLRPVYGTASRPMGVTAESVGIYIERGGDVSDSFFTRCASKDAQAGDCRTSFSCREKVQAPVTTRARELEAKHNKTNAKSRKGCL